MEKKQLVETLQIALAETLANLHTATIAKVTAVGEKTISCRPVINREVNGESVQLPKFIEVPPLFMQGGTSYTAHPIAVDDYCLLVITERCFDRWYEGQDYRRPAEFRMHDYSDGVAIVGLNPKALAITIPAVITQIGDAYEEGNVEHAGNRTQTGDYTLTGAITHEGSNTQTGDHSLSGNVEAATYSAGGAKGVSGTFTSQDGKTVTVTKGLITGIA